MRLKAYQYRAGALAPGEAPQPRRFRTEVNDVHRMLFRRIGNHVYVLRWLR